MPTTSNFGWTTPADTDLVKDGAAAIRTLGNGIDASLVDLKGGTTGQILSKNSNTDLDYTWINNDQGDITEVQAGTGISVASGTGPVPVVTNTVATTFDAKGDLVVGTGADTFAKLTVGTNGHTLVADSAQTTGLKWAAPSSGALVLVKTQTIGTAVASVTVSDAFSASYDNYLILIAGGTGSSSANSLMTLGATTTGYYSSGFYMSYGSTAVNGFNTNNGSSWNGTYYSSTGHVGYIIVQAPYLTKETTQVNILQGATGINYGISYLANTTSYTAFTLTNNGGTFTGGEIRVYGYANS